MKRTVVESEFFHGGLRCVVLALEMGHRCGYVGVPKGHVLYGAPYNDPCEALRDAYEDALKGPIGKRGAITVLCATENNPTPEIVFDVHGSLTFSGDLRQFSDSGLWWFGFDCAHCDDAKDYSIMSDKYAEIERRFPRDGSGHVWTQGEVEDECRSLADQIISACESRRGSHA